MPDNKAPLTTALETPEAREAPIAPVQPDLDDCCNRGCYPCVFDTYDDAMDRYRAALKRWEKQKTTKP